MTTAPHDTEGPAVHPGALGSGIASSDRWGPFAIDIEPSERLARLRCLRTLAHILCGPAGLALQASIRRAEASATDATLDAVLTEMDALPSIPRRHLLASFAAVSRAEPPRQDLSSADDAHRLPAHPFARANARRVHRNPRDRTPSDGRCGR